MTMTIPRAILEEIFRHGEAAWPKEACGLLFGARNTIDQSAAIRNAADEMKGDGEFTRSAEQGYVMDPGEQMRAISAAERAGKSVLGIWHSHPDVGAYFSAEDRRRALFDGEPIFPGALWVVLDIQKRKAASMKAFGWSETAGDFQEVPLQIVE